MVSFFNARACPSQNSSNSFTALKKKENEKAGVGGREEDGDITITSVGLGAMPLRPLERVYDLRNIPALTKATLSTKAALVLAKVLELEAQLAVAQAAVAAAPVAQPGQGQNDPFNLP